MNDVADALLAAHVQHTLARLRGDAFSALVRERTAVFFEWLGSVKFREIATSEQIIEIIDRYVIELKVSGGITELAGEMANAVFSSKLGAETPVAEIVNPESYEEFADKIVGLRRVHRDMVRAVTGSPAFATLAARVFARMAFDFVFRGEGSGAAPVRTLLSGLFHQLVPGFDRRVVSKLSDYVERHAGRITREAERTLLDALDPEWVRQMSDELWDAVADRPLSEAAAGFTSQDLEDFVVLGYEFWLKFRKTRYFKAVSAEVVERLFAKYGDETVLSVVNDMGVTEHMIAQEIVNFVEPALELARRTGYLERELRVYLEPFYRSEAFESVLSASTLRRPPE